MIKNKDLFFISSAWNTGTGFVVKGYNFIITTIQVVGFSKKVIIRHSKIGKHVSEVVFIDYSNGLVFLKLPQKVKSTIDIINFQLSVVEQQVKIFRTNFNNEILNFNAEIKTNSTKQIIIKLENHLKVSGGLLINNKNEIVGVTKYIEKENKYIGLPAKYLLKSMEEFTVIDDFSLRCPNCLNIIKKSNIIDKVCPSCTAEIKEELLEEFVPRLSKINTKIEKTLTDLGFKLELTRLGQNFWEIEEGTATIFIRYVPDKNFIVAFSKLIDLNNRNSSKIYKYLLTENNKLNELALSINKNRVFLTTPYIFEEDFDEDLAKKIFADLFKNADYFDDTIKKMQNII